jgi:hypothetical protein
VPAELAYLDALAAIDSLLARRAALDETLSLLATASQRWPIVARLRRMSRSPWNFGTAVPV